MLRGVMSARARRHHFARNGVRPARAAAALAAHQVHVDVVVVIDVVAGRQHRRECLAGVKLHVVQEALLFRRAVPAVLDRDLAAVGEREAGDVERVAEGVLRHARAADHVAARVAADLVDRGDRRAEPMQRRRLHAFAHPAVERRDDRTGERRRRLQGGRLQRRRFGPRIGPSRGGSRAAAADRPARCRPAACGARGAPALPPGGTTASSGMSSGSARADGAARG